jgi:hypothetical protein
MHGGQKLEERTRLDEAKLTDDQKAALPPEWYGKGGVNPDWVAGIFGYDSASELINYLVRFEKNRDGLKLQDYMNKIVNDEVERRMRRRFGDTRAVFKTAPKEGADPTAQGKLL